MTRVLIVEDEIIIAEDIKDALLKLGYEVPAVLHSGEEAIRASEELRPDIVLMDIILKGVVDGFTAAEQITGLFGIPLIFLTAHADAKTFERAKVTNPYGYLLKPFDIHALQHAIEISLYKHELGARLRESEQKFRSLFNQASDAIFLLLPVDDDLIIQDANYAALEMHGYAKDELAGKSISLLDDPETRRHIAERVKRLMSGEPLHAQGVHVRKDGSSFPVDISAQRIYIGYKPYVLAIDRDITDRKKAEQALIESEAKFRDLVESTSDWVWETDENGRYTYSSPKVKDVLGYDVPEVIGKTPFDFMPEDEAHKIITAFDGIKAEPRPFHGLENINRHKRGHLVVLESSGVPVFDKDGQLRGFRGIDRDITQRKKIEQKLHEMSITDELTGLLNRRGFFALADQQCKLADRTKRQMCLIYIDLDGLKIINDELGHETGDRALIETAEVLKKTFRESDIMARIGGDEFVVLLTEPAETGVENVTARLIEENLRVHNTQAGRKFELMFSMGSAIYDPERPCSVNDLISRADESMYADKQRRRLER